MERIRRALIIDEAKALRTTTAYGVKHHGLIGRTRSLIYGVALSTGLRYNEIYTLNRADITFGDEPKVIVRAKNAKNKKAQSVPLRPELAKELEQYFVNNLAMPHTRAFSGMWKDAGAAMLKVDLELAGIEYETEEGIADFHSLRHTFCNMLRKAGIDSEERQKLMRHSDIKLTTNTYGHAQYGDLAEAIDRLPKIEIQKNEQAKTGTADVPENFSTNFSKNPIKTKQNSAKWKFVRPKAWKL